MKSIRGRGGAQKLAAAIKADPNLRQRILDAPNRVYLYDKNSPSVKARRARYRNEFLLILRPLLGSDAENLTDEELHKKLFAPSMVVNNVISYIDAIASADASLFPGQFGKIKTSTVRQRTEALWWFAGWEAGDRAGEVWTSWNHKIPPAIHQAAVTYDLSTGKFAKEYFGVPELRLMFSMLCSRTRYVDWYKQHYVAWVMAFINGVRPGSMALSAGYTDITKEVQAIKWEDVRFLRDENAPGIFLRIHYKWLKGQRDPHSAKSAGFTGAHFLVHPCKEPENLVVDLTWLLLCLGKERGLFGNSTLDELLNSPDSEIAQDPTVAKQAIFLSLKGPNNTELDVTNPLRANMFNPPLQRAAYAAGLAVRVTIYVFRREFITTMGRNLSVEEAKTLATHRSEQLGAYGRYDFGMGDLSVAGIVTGESSAISEVARQRNRYRRRISSAAILNRADFPEDEANTFVAQLVQGDDMLVSFEESLVLLLDAARGNYGIQNASTVKGTLEALNALPLEASSNITEPWVVPDDMDKYDPPSYVARMDAVYKQSPAHAASFLSKFLKARRAARNWVMSSAHKTFERQWMMEVGKPSVMEVKERLEEAKNVPDVLGLPKIGSKRKAEELGRVNTARSESQLSREIEAETNNAAEMGLEDDELDAVDLTAMDVDNAIDDVDAELSNEQSGDDATAVENDEEVDPNMLEMPLIPMNAGPILAYPPGEEGEQGQDSEVIESATETSDPVAMKEYYDMARDGCINAWLNCAEVSRGECECRLCKYSVEGEYQYSFLRTKPTGTTYESAYKFNRHIWGTLHNPEECQFALWAHDRAKGTDGAYICPLPECAVRSKFRRLPGFRDHVKKLHGAFYKRLYH